MPDQTQQPTPKSAKVSILAFAHKANDTRVYEREAKYLLSQGYDVTMLVRGEHRFIPLKTERQNGIVIYEIPARPHSELLKLLRDPFDWLWMLVISFVLFRKADVYHCHEYQSCLIGILLAKLFKKKVIFDCHEFDSETFGSQVAQFSPRLKDRAIKVFDSFERWIASKVDAVITVNEKLVDRFERDAEEVVLLPNYPSIAQGKRFSRPHDSFLNEIGGCSVLAFVGYLSDTRKIKFCVEVLQELVQQNKKIKMVFIGRAVPTYLKELKDLIKNKNLENNIIFTGHVTLPEVMGYLSVTDIGVCLLRPEIPLIWIQATKLFQYAAAGLPMLLNDTGAHRDFVQEGGGAVLVPSVGRNEVSSVVMDLLNDPAKMKQMGAANKKLFYSKWNADIALESIGALYERFI